jgi:hypothetical protein
MNTEVPNLLALAAVTDSVTTSSHKFWAEGMWHGFFRNNPEFELAAAWSIESDTAFIYPMTLYCRINFQSYFQLDNGLLEYAHVSNSIIHQVRASRGYFLIDVSAEAWVEDDHLAVLHSYFNHLRIPLNKVIYLTGCMNPDVMYESYCQRNNITNSPECRLNIVSFPISQNSISIAMQYDKTQTEPIYDPNLIPSKTFLSWNRRHRSHRSILAIAMHKEGLLPKSYLSMLQFDPDQGRTRFEDTFSHNTASVFELTPGDIQNFTALLPLIIDGETNINAMCADNENKTSNFYTDSLLSIITETNFDALALTLTEKSFKQFKQKHPFIVVAPAGSLVALHNLGFKTFSDFWSEEYDNIQDSNNRLKEILRICKEIAQWDDAKIIDFKHRAKEIVEHNYNQVKISSSVAASQNIINIIRKNSQ